MWRPRIVAVDTGYHDGRVVVHVPDTGKTWVILPGGIGVPFNNQTPEWEGVKAHSTTWDMLVDPEEADPYQPYVSDERPGQDSPGFSTMHAALHVLGRPSALPEEICEEYPHYANLVAISHWPGIKDRCARALEMYTETIHDSVSRWCLSQNCTVSQLSLTVPGTWGEDIAEYYRGVMAREFVEVPVDKISMHTHSDSLASYIQQELTPGLRKFLREAKGYVKVYFADCGAQATVSRLIFVPNYLPALGVLFEPGLEAYLGWLLTS